MGTRRPSPVRRSASWAAPGGARAASKCADWHRKDFCSGTASQQRFALMQELYRYVVQCHAEGVYGAVVWDIDQTLISEAHQHPRKFKTTVKMYNKLLRMGVPMYIVTARLGGKVAEAETHEELQHEQYGLHVRKYEKLYLLPEPMAHDPGAYKAKARRAIARRLQKQNLRLLATVGDQLWDVLDLDGRRLPVVFEDLDRVRHGAILRAHAADPLGFLLPKAP